MYKDEYKSMLSEDGLVMRIGPGRKPFLAKKLSPDEDLVQAMEKHLRGIGVKLVKAEGDTEAKDVIMFIPTEFWSKNFDPEQRPNKELSFYYFIFKNLIKTVSKEINYIVGYDEFDEAAVIGFSTNKKVELDFEFDDYESVQILSMGSFCVDEDTIGEVLANAMDDINPKKMYDYIRTKVIGQDNAVKLGTVAIYKYLQSIINHNMVSQNILMTGPSGSGKTEFYRALKEFFKLNNIPLPVVQVDMTQITGNGYKGEDSHYLCDRLLNENKDLHGYGILFIDEIDKRCLASYSSRGVDQNAEVQGQILTMLEGTVMELEKGKFDSTRTLFVGIGSFQDIRDRRREKKKEKVTGFLSQSTADSEKATEIIFEELTIDDIIDYGMKEELAGRFSVLMNFNRVSEKNMESIVGQKIALLEKELDISVSLSRRAIDEIVAKSYGPCGIRTPMNILRQLCYQALANRMCSTDDYDYSQKKTIVIRDLASAYVDDYDLEDFAEDF